MTGRTSVIAVDLGGTKVSAAVIDSEGKIFFRKKARVNRGDARACAEQIRGLVDDARSAASASSLQTKAMGLIVPGIYFAGSGNVWAPNLWGHEQVPLRAELDRFMGLPFVVDSDRAGYVMGERWMGAARGLSDVVFVSVGTGIGAGIVANGRLLRGAADIAGAVGWLALNPAKRDCYKQVGCWEAEAAGPALARRANAKSAEHVVTAARNGDRAANRAIAETAQYLAMGIANLISILNPQMIVLGGGLMQAGDLFIDSVRKGVTDWAQPVSAQQVRIELTQLGEDAGLLGAAYLALENS
jgi:glucokinase